MNAVLEELDAEYDVEDSIPTTDDLSKGIIFDLDSLDDEPSAQEAYNVDPFLKSIGSTVNHNNNRVALAIERLLNVARVEGHMMKSLNDKINELTDLVNLIANQPNGIKSALTVQKADALAKGSNPRAFDYVVPGVSGVDDLDVDGKMFSSYRTEALQDLQKSVQNGDLSAGVFKNLALIPSDTPLSVVLNALPSNIRSVVSSAVARVDENN